MSAFEGRWHTRFGAMTLARNGERLEGTYSFRGTVNRIGGVAREDRFEFEYEEAAERGRGVFELTREGRFNGSYLADGASEPREWFGNRPFDGLWFTTVGTLRLVQSGGDVRGYLNNPADSILEGRVEADRLHWRLVGGPQAEGEVDIGEDLDALTGRWRVPEAEEADFKAVRALPNPNIAWLVVLEAHWQRSLEDQEFAFGDMLGEVFARLPHVNVRHRFFHDETSLVHWCREVMFLPEPVVLVVTSHGEKEGIRVLGKLIDTPKVIDALRFAENVKLLHFSCCLIGQGGAEALSNRVFPVSGYTNSVDWNASALSEFIYLDMMLGKGLSPEAAAAQLVRLVGFVGAEAPEGSPYPPAGFTFVPRKSSVTSGPGTAGDSGGRAGALSLLRMIGLR